MDDASVDARSFAAKDFRAPFLNASELYYRLKMTKAKEEPGYTKAKKLELTPWTDYEEIKVDPIAKVLRLKYEIDQAKDVFLSIYSSKGREEKIKRFSAQPEGNYTRIISLKDFLPGTYLLRMKMGEQTNLVKRLVVPEQSN